MPQSAHTSWYLVQTKPNAHAVAVRNLARQGFSTFLPLQDVTGRKVSRFVNTLRPLFPGYLFVEVPEGTAPWRSVNGTLGVARIVQFGAAPERVPEDLVSTLRDRCDEDGRLVHTAEVAAGDQVKIMQGPLAEFVATVDQIEPDRRVWLLLDLMGHKTQVKLAADHLARVT